MHQGYGIFLILRINFNVDTLFQTYLNCYTSLSALPNNVLKKMMTLEFIVPLHGHRKNSVTVLPNMPTKSMKKSTLFVSKTDNPVDF